MDRETKINELISQMTLEEKVSQLSYTSPAIPRLGIPEYNWWNECLHGVARAGAATVFPQAIALAATFDEGFVEEVACAISDEARAKYNEAIKRGNRGQYWGLTFWTPNINIFRDPRWGRGQETYGEDPFLTSRIGVAFVQGLQGDDPENLKLAACAKHYAVHSGPEKLRHTFDAVVSKKDLFETYLPAFKALVDAGVESVMGAYNRTLGEPCCGSYFLLKDILRERWGFKGHVVSDCWAIRDFHEYHKVTNSPEESAALALNSGCDLNCGCTYPMLTVSYKKGLVSEETINTALARLLRTRFKLGMFDFSDCASGSHKKYEKLNHDVINCGRHQILALKAAEKSIVLLKNKNNILPLDDGARRITLVGPSAANPLALFGNYYGISPRFITFLEGLGNKVRDKYAINLEYRPGCLQYRENTLSQFGAQTGFFTGAETDILIAVMGLDGSIEGEESDAIASDSNGDRDTIELPPWQLDYLRTLRETGLPLILVLTGGSPIAIPEDIADAIIFAWYPGEQGGKALADIIFGDAVPSGKLPVTFPASSEQLPPYEDYSMKGRTYRYMTEKPLYPFGFGLSYTSFRFDSISLSSPVIPAAANLAGDTVKATVTITNTGKRDGEEVIQIYISRDEREMDEPLFSLRGFRRILIPAGKSATVDFELPASAFETINDEGESVLLRGTYTVIASDAAPLPVSVERGAPVPVSAKIKS